MASGVASAIRPGLRDISSRQPSGSPHTPTGRYVSSAQSSPGSYSFRAEEDPVIIELDPRGLRAGFQGDSGPHCYIPFSPENSRRVGDYRPFLPGFRRRKEHVEARSKEYELWRNDLKDVDLDLVEDKLERAVRAAYNKHLLVDAGSARLVLVLPSLVPHPVLSTILTFLFERWKYSTITLLPAPTMSIASAGLRSGVVVDIGWEETVITAVYEYREIQVHRSVRAMKVLTMKVSEMLEAIRKAQDSSFRDSLVLDFDFVEEFVLRASAAGGLVPDVADLNASTAAISIGEPGQQPGQPEADSLVFDWPAPTSSHRVNVPLQPLRQIYLDAFISPKTDKDPDDHELPISQLLYRTLLDLPNDIRSLCISRILFTGRGFQVAGLARHVLDTTKTMVVKHGWTAVRGRKLKDKRAGLAELAQGRTMPPDARHDTTVPGQDDFVEARLFKQRSRDEQTQPATLLRQVDTLGAWAGASLMGTLKAKAYVEVERERFLTHGLTGAHRDFDPGVNQQQKTTTKGNERTSWTLAGWG